MTTDPFMDPATPPSAFPTLASLRGRLVLVKPTKQETVPNNLGQPGSTQQRVTADVTVVDGRGPVPVVKQGSPTGQTLEGPEFRGMWIQGEFITTQLAEALRSGGMVLGTVNTPKTNMPPGKGNAWGLTRATDADKQTARDFLAGRTIGATQEPAQVAPPAPQQITPPTSGVNPFA